MRRSIAWVTVGMVSVALFLNWAKPVPAVLDAMPESVVRNDRLESRSHVESRSHMESSAHVGTPSQRIVSLAIP